MRRIRNAQSSVHSKGRRLTVGRVRDAVQRRGGTGLV